MPLIIIDRKKKRANSDNQWVDALGLEEARKEKARTIDIPSDSDNPIHKFIRTWGSHKLLLGKKVFCLNDRKEMLSGFIVDVIAPYYLSLRNKGVVKFSDVISVGD